MFSRIILDGNLHISSQPFSTLHPEHAKPGLHIRLSLATERSCQTQPQHFPRLRWRDDTIIPQTSRRKGRLGFTVNAFFQSRISGSSDSLHNGRELLRAHNADLGIGPHEEKTRRVGTATKAILVRKEPEIA